MSCRCKLSNDVRICCQPPIHSKTVKSFFNCPIRHETTATFCCNDYDLFKKIGQNDFSFLKKITKDPNEIKKYKDAILEEININEPYFVTPVDKSEVEIPKDELLNLKYKYWFKVKSDDDDSEFYIGKNEVTQIPISDEIESSLKFYI